MKNNDLERTAAMPALLALASRMKSGIREGKYWGCCQRVMERLKRSLTVRSPLELLGLLVI